MRQDFVAEGFFGVTGRRHVACDKSNGPVGGDVSSLDASHALDGSGRSESRFLILEYTETKSVVVEAEACPEAVDDRLNFANRKARRFCMGR